MRSVDGESVALGIMNREPESWWTSQKVAREGSLAPIVANMLCGHWLMRN